MQCDRCGETMRQETVIRLRRSFGRVRATQRQGGYCANCGASAALDNGPCTEALGAGGAWARLALRATTALLPAAAGQP